MDKSGSTMQPARLMQNTSSISRNMRRVTAKGFFIGRRSRSQNSTAATIANSPSTSQRHRSSRNSSFWITMASRMGRYQSITATAAAISTSGRSVLSP